MFEETIKPLTAWLHMHPHWAGVITFLISFSESLAVVGSIIPGSVTMTAIGMLVGSGVIGVIPTFTCAILGAIAGDGVSYWLGYHYHAEIKRMWPFSRYPGMFVSGEAFFQRHGGKSVFIGRFAGPMRSFIPVIAGMLHMQRWNFFIANITSAFAWSVAYLLPGILLGAAALELSPETATRFVLLILGSLIAIWLLTWFIKWASLHLINITDRTLDNMWRFMRTHPRLVWLTRVMQDPSHPHGHGQLVLAFVILTLLLVLTGLVLCISKHCFITTLNEPLFYFFQGIRTVRLDKLFTFVTLLAEPKSLLVFAGLIALYFCFIKQWRLVFHWVSNTALITLLVFGFKHWLAYPRPAGNMVVRATSSFPSGHVGLFTAILGFLCFLLARQLPRGVRRTVYVPLVCLIILIAVSRLYLGAHWLTDVSGSFLLGSSCVLISVLSYRREHLPRLRSLPLLLTALLCLGVVWFATTMHLYEQQLHAYQPKHPVKHVPMMHWWRQKQPLLPLFRLNRFGHPIALMNIQYAGELEKLEQHLMQQGWTPVGKPTFYTTLNRIAAEDKSKLLPVFTPLYRTQHPVLTMTKQINTAKPLLVLRLWRSGLVFDDSETPIWLGSIHFRITWHYRWLRQYRTSSLPDYFRLLRPALRTFTTKKVSYPAVLPVQHQHESGTKANILLIR